MTIVEGQIVKVGDLVGFKDGVEQYGRIYEIRGDFLTIECYDSNTGQPYYAVESADRCWIEG